MKWGIDFISGMISGTCGLFVGYPFDTIKCRMQTARHEYTNIFTSFLKIVREEGFFGLYKGVTSPMINQFPINAILFSEYYRMLRFLDKEGNNTGRSLSRGVKQYISGMYAGFIVVFIMTPTELIKIQMQNDRDKFNSLYKVGRDIYNKKGIKGLYKGYYATLNRDFYSYGAYFYVYNQLKEYWERNNSLTKFKQFCAGGLGGIISWIICYPFDPIKTLIQTTEGERTMTQMEAIRYIKHHHGWIGFMRGINTIIIMSFFRHGVIFTTNDLCRSYFSYLN